MPVQGIILCHISCTLIRPKIFTTQLHHGCDILRMTKNIVWTEAVAITLAKLMKPLIFNDDKFADVSVQYCTCYHGHGPIPE